MEILMDKELTSLLIITEDIKEIGLTDTKVDKVSSFIKMDQTIKDAFIKDVNKEKENYNILTRLIMKASSKIVLYKAME